MPMFIPLLLLFVFFICSLWFHDVWFPPEGRTHHHNRSYYHDRH